MAIHAGHPEQRGDDYFGPPLNRVARLLASAHGGQILVSRAAGALAGEQLPPETKLRDLGEHALKDLRQAERVFQVMAPGLQTEFPPLRTPELLLRNVPRPATPLIGRAEEIARIREIFGLAPEDGVSSAVGPAGARLVTLTGPGGAGKTRLSLHLAATLGVEFADGAVFVALAAITDPALVPVEIAGALELGESGGESPRDLVVESLRDRHLLLILDNYEQVMGASELVADLLAHCPRLHVVVTSRERLNVRGEVDLPLPPLGLPEMPRRTASDAPGGVESLSLDEVRRSEAVRLFVERARAAQPAFDVTAENATAIVEICRRLDGLPLAIELAAARARLLPPGALLDRLDRRLDLLSRGNRDLPARQKTMRDTIAWSYDLLDPPEQRLFSRVSVFVGGATLDAVATVAGDEREVDTFDLVESLADKSLLRLVVEGDEPRVMMLQTIRDYGLERLDASGEREATRKRHAELFLALAEEAEPLLEGREQTRWLDRLDGDQDNLRAAIGWLRESGLTDEALRLGGALWRFWWLRGDMGEGRGQLEALLREPDGVSPAVRAKALNGAGVLAESQGDWETAARFHQESLEISRGLGDLPGVAWSLNNLGVVAMNQGDIARARSLLEENLAVAEQAGDASSVATALMDLGQIERVEGDPEQASALLTRSLALFRELGNESQIARALTNLGAAACERGESERALTLFTESLTRHRDVGDRLGIAGTLNNLAAVERNFGNQETAMRLYLESHVLALEAGNQLYAAIAMENLAALTRSQGDIATAELRYREALLLYHAVGDMEGIITCLGGLALAAADHGENREAVTLLGFVSTASDQQGVPAPGEIEEAVRVLREKLSVGEFEEAWARGLALSIDEAIDWAANRDAHGLRLASS
jgi:predicted ATPase